MGAPTARASKSQLEQSNCQEGAYAPSLHVVNQRVTFMDNLLPLIVQLVSGAVGGNVAGALIKKISLGTVGNSIAGIVGGGLGGQLLDMLGVATTTGGMDVASIVGSIAGGGVGGGVLMAIIGVIKKAIAK